MENVLKTNQTKNKQTKKSPYPPTKPSQTQSQKDSANDREELVDKLYSSIITKPQRATIPTRSPPLVLKKFVAKRFCAQEIKQISVSPLWFLRLISCSLTPWTSEAVLSYHTQVEVSVVGTVLEKKRNWIKITYIHTIFIHMSVQSIKIIKYLNVIH